MTARDSNRHKALASSILRTRTMEEDQDAWRQLSKLFREIEEWHAAVSGTHPVHAQSPLGIADELSDPFQASHAVGYLRLTAVDHLHALRTLMQEAQSQHIFAPFSVIRSALESASTALWILTDPDPRAIAVRSLKQEWVNLRELRHAYQTIGAPEKDLTARYQRFDAVIEKNRMKKDGITANPPGSLKMLQRACDAFELGSVPVLMWQMCSGATHGRNWITGFLTMMEAQDDGVSKIVKGRLTSDAQAILVATYAACDVVRRLFTVMQNRARLEYHTGAAFQKAAPGLLVPTPGLYLP